MKRNQYLRRETNKSEINSNSLKRKLRRTSEFNFFRVCEINQPIRKKTNPHLRQYTLKHTFAKICKSAIQKRGFLTCERGTRSSSFSLSICLPQNAAKERGQESWERIIPLSRVQKYPNRTTIDRTRNQQREIVRVKRARVSSLKEFSVLSLWVMLDFFRQN